MKKIISIFTFSLIVLAAQAQETMQQVMEKRAREMHRVICFSDKEQWKKFIKENYSQAFIDKPMKSKISQSNDSGTTSDSKETTGNVDGKADMFQRLHNDFGDSKIVSIKTNGDKLEMQLSGTELSGTFSFTFTSSKPYLIDGLGIRVEGGNR